MKINRDFLKKFVGNFGVVIAFASGIAYALNYISLDLFVTFLGLGGFAGLAGLRDAIQASGWKTWLISGIGALISIGLGSGVIAVENATILMSLLGVGAIPTLGHAISKMEK